MKNENSGALSKCSWADALTAVSNELSSVDGSEIAVVAGGFACAESLTATKDLMNRLGCENLFTEERFPLYSGYATQLLVHFYALTFSHMCNSTGFESNFSVFLTGMSILITHKLIHLN